MIPSLAPCFTGALLRFKDKLALPGEHPHCIDGKDLLDTATAERLLLRFAQAYPGADRRALVSMWTQWHFGALIIPTTAAILLLNRDVPVDLNNVSIALHKDGRTTAIIIAHDGTPLGPLASDRFSRLLYGHVEPLIGRFAESFKTSRRLLWTNAATIFDWALRQAGGDAASPVASAEGRALLEHRTHASGQSNPMFDAVRHRKYGRGEPVLTRKICCLRYLLPGVKDCGSLCPLPAKSR